MITAAMNLGLILIMAAVHVLWIGALANYDGKCHEKHCDGCPYEEGFLFEDGCPYERDHEDMEGSEDPEGGRDGNEGFGD